MNIRAGIKKWVIIGFMYNMNAVMKLSLVILQVKRCLGKAIGKKQKSGTKNH